MLNTRFGPAGNFKNHPAKTNAENLINLGFDDTPDTITAILDRWTKHRESRAELDQTSSLLGAEFHQALENGDTDTAREYAIRQAVADTMSTHQEHISQHEDTLAAELNSEVLTWLRESVIPTLRATFNLHADQFTKIAETVGAPYTLTKILNSRGDTSPYTKLISHGEAMNRCVEGLKQIEAHYGIQFGSHLTVYTPAMPSRWHYADTEARAKELSQEEPLKPIAFWLAVLETPQVGGNPAIAILDREQRDKHTAQIRSIADKYERHGAVNVREAVLTGWKETQNATH